MQKSDKRDEIVRAALELIAGQGFHGAPMAMIAEKAGVGAGTIYRYFENKDVLITDLYREIEEKVMASINEGYSTGRPIRERFLHLGMALLRYFISSPLEFRYVEQFHNSPYGTECRRDKIMGKGGGCNDFKELFEEGVAQQVVKDLPLVMLFDLTFGPLMSVARDHNLGFMELDDRLIERIVEACWEGVKR